MAAIMGRHNPSWKPKNNNQQTLPLMTLTGRSHEPLQFDENSLGLRPEAISSRIVISLPPVFKILTNLSASHATGGIEINYGIKSYFIAWFLG